MDPVTNPYAPGAGSPPPELAGRKEHRKSLSIALQRVRGARPVRPVKSVLLVGLRGVRKTVLLNQMQTDAEAIGIETLWVEAPENRSLPAILAPKLRVALLKLSRNERARDLATQALRGLAGFVQGLRLKYRDIELGLDFEPGPGPHRSGEIADALAPTRSQLIGKGMVWSPSHGDIAFTVPLFDAFMRRIMPSGDWKAVERR